jgi:signal transduction histidine kinase
MAFSSISNRLWLTYLVIVVLVLMVAFAGIVIAFQRSPILYRQVFYRISLVNGFLTERLTLVYPGEWKPFIRLFLNEVNITDVNVAILDRNGVFILTSEGTEQSDLPTVANPDVFSEKSRDKILTHRDHAKRYWFYQVSRIDNDHYLLTAAQRPDTSISVLLQDELMKPLFRAGIIALVISFFTGWLIARWITRPLEKISAAAGQIAGGKYVAVPIEGPEEVRQLAGSFNEMIGKVEDSLQSQKDFVANVSHEFKTPLTSIQGFAQAISDDVITGKRETKKAAGIIQNETARLNQLVNDLLLLARLDAGTMAIQKSDADISQIAENTLERLKFLIQGKKLKVKKALESLVIYADSEKISQVITNLLDNAIKFSPEGTEIGLLLRQDKDKAVIEISDSGPGITMADQKRIFERFFQVDKSRKGGLGRGVGLGLAIARQIVLAHDGDIKVISQPGEGSTFLVMLPIHGKTTTKNGPNYNSSS